MRIYTAKDDIGGIKHRLGKGKLRAGMQKIGSRILINEKVIQEIEVLDSRSYYDK